MTGSGIKQMGTISGIVLAVMMVVGFGLDITIIITSGGPPLLDPQNISAELLRAQKVAIWPMELWLYTLMVIPGCVLAITAYRALRTDPNDSLAATGLLATVLFWIFHTLHNVLMLAIFQALVPHYASASPDAISIQVTVSTILNIAYTIFNFGSSIGGLFLAAALAAFGLAILKSDSFPHWTGYVALAASLTVVGSYLQFLSGAFFFLGILGWLLFIVWVIGATLALTRPVSVAQLPV